MNTHRYITPLLIILTISVSSCKLADLSEGARIDSKNSDPHITEKLLQRMSSAHGLANWERMGPYEVKIEDTFYGTVNKAISPYEKGHMSGHLSLNYANWDGLLTFEKGQPKGTTWEINHGTYIIQKPKKKANPGNHREVKFWIPTYKYFIEMPKRLQEGTVRALLPEADYNGKTYNRIIFSWNKLSPQKELDQYVIWIDQETDQIALVQYTIREIGKVFSGLAEMHDYRNVEGIMIPFSMRVKPKLDASEYMHRMELKEVKFKI